MCVIGSFWGKPFSGGTHKLNGLRVVFRALDKLNYVLPAKSGESRIESKRWQSSTLYHVRDSSWSDSYECCYFGSVEHYADDCILGYVHNNCANCPWLKAGCGPLGW